MRISIARLFQKSFISCDNLSIKTDTIKTTKSATQWIGNNYRKPKNKKYIGRYAYFQIEDRASTNYNANKKKECLNLEKQEKEYQVMNHGGLKEK